MKIGGKSRKRLIIATSALTALIIVVLVAVSILGGVLHRKNFTWSSLSYHFPDALILEGIIAEPDESFSFELDHLEVAWSWGGLSVLIQPVSVHIHQQFFVNACFVVNSLTVIFHP